MGNVRWFTHVRRVCRCQREIDKLGVIRNECAAGLRWRSDLGRTGIHITIYESVHIYM